jgi:hypothetical protein
MEAPNYIIISLITVLFGIARYFFKDLHNKFIESEKKNEETTFKVNKLESKVVRLEEKMPSDIQHLETVINLKLDEVTKTIQHLEKSLNNQAEAYVTLLKEYTKK